MVERCTNGPFKLERGNKHRKTQEINRSGKNRICVCVHERRAREREKVKNKKKEEYHTTFPRKTVLPAASVQMRPTYLANRLVRDR